MKYLSLVFFPINGNKTHHKSVKKKSNKACIIRVRCLHSSGILLIYNLLDRLRNVFMLQIYAHNKISAKNEWEKREQTANTHAKTKLCKVSTIQWNRKLSHCWEGQDRFFIWDSFKTIPEWQEGSGQVEGSMFPE